MKRFKYILPIFFAFILSCEKEEFDFLQSNSRVLFISRRVENSSQWNLFVMNSDGTGQVRIIDMPATCAKPVVSNTGKTALFVHFSETSFYELYSTNIEGTELTLIDHAKRYCGSPAWSSDDKKIIYSRSRNESSDERDLVLYDVNTSSKEVLTSFGNNFSASFSPDNWIAYCHQNPDYSIDIYRMNMDGSGRKKIIANAWNPVFSPDGKLIAYQKVIENGSSQIFVANTDGTNQKQLTSSYSSRIWPGWPPDGNCDPKWSPDGKKIVYVSWEDNDPEIHIMNSCGSNKTKLTDTNKRDEHPEITDDGRFILFTSNRNLEMDAEIYVMNINGKNQKALSNYRGADIYPIEIK